MATAAGLTLLHLAHRNVFIPHSGNEEIRMAILAAISGDMYRMTEYCAPWTEMDLFDSMTFLAFGFNAKGGFAFMAGTARFPLFHIGHAGTNALFSSFEYIIVAINTFVHAVVNCMAKGSGSGFLDFENNIDGRFVTFITISFYAERGRTIVTAAT